MPQENNRNSKQPRFGNRPPGNPDDPNQPPRKGPRFSIYWIYAIIFAILIGFQIFGGALSGNMAKTNFLKFKDMVAKGEVEKYTVIDNRKVVKIFLTKPAIELYRDKLKAGISGKIGRTVWADPMLDTIVLARPSASGGRCASTPHPPGRVRARSGF